MARGCKIDKQEGNYFLTFTIVQWLHVLAEYEQKMMICESLNYCVKEKGLEIYAYVIMSSHMHLICKSINNDLSGVVRDFKKHTSRKIINHYLEQNDEMSFEILNRFAAASNHHSRNKKYQVWQQDNYPIEIYSKKFTLQKVKYIHNNPVAAGIVEWPPNYYFSSAVDYYGGKGPVEIKLLNLHNLID